MLLGPILQHGKRKPIAEPHFYPHALLAKDWGGGTLLINTVEGKIVRSSLLKSLFYQTSFTGGLREKEFCLLYTPRVGQL